ncbi:nitroreductase family protein [Mycolicibacterium sp.]|uniref:nitroreductase family protein n=1 Tax=Mycolicibacterium sp. TaxID=2320850 RepID=UPI003D11B5BA
MDVFEVMRTTRAMRRLDPTRDIPEEDLWRVIEAATRAPSGGNTQPVRWLVVREAEPKRALAEIYQKCWAQARIGYASDPVVAKSAMLRSADYLAEHFADAPAVILPCARNAAAASVFPGIQNLMLAARALDIGTTLTTVHIEREAEVKEVLGIPDDVRTYALIPMGYPLGRWGEAPRRPVSEVTYWNSWKRHRERPEAIPTSS